MKKLTTTQTPIEIALQIDENGMTTAKNLYSFLELEPQNYSHWCKRNIKNNKFAIENEDYIVFVPEDENTKTVGRPKTDYKLTSEFAKKLSMTGNTERHEEARKYFIACEQGLKIATKKLQSLQSLAEVITSLNQNIFQMQQDIQAMKEESLKKKLPEKKYSRWKNNYIQKAQHSSFIC